MNGRVDMYSYDTINVIRDLEDFILDKYVLIDFSDPKTENNYVVTTASNGNKGIYLDNVTTFDYYLPFPVNFNSRNYIEIDVYPSIDIPENSVIIDFIEYGSVSSVKESASNDNEIERDKSGTLRFNLKESLTEKNLSSIGSIRITFNAPFTGHIHKINAYTNNYNVTNEEIIETTRKAEKYIISSIQEPEIPTELIEARNYITCAWIWSKSNGLKTDKENSYHKILLDRGMTLINLYLYKGLKNISNKERISLQGNGGYQNITIKGFWDDII